jgi:rare lipoprotein A
MAVSRQLKAVIVPTFLAMLIAMLLGGCAGQLPFTGTSPMPAPGKGPATHPPVEHDLPALPAAGSGRGGYYKDDGPGDAPPPNLRDIPDAQVKAEPLSRYANRPYTVFGKTYVPMVDDQPLVQRGVSSWYGKKFHGQKTSSGEIYDMYKMTAAHPTLPIPSYARVTHMATGKQVVVRINDRGPFHAGRIVDLSYTAALKIGLLGAGSHEVRLERLLPNATERLATIRRNAPEAEAPPAAVPSDVTALILENKAEIKAVKAHEGQVDSVPLAQPAVGGFYVQMGAFSRSAKAAEIRARIAGHGWSAAALDVQEAGALHRVLSGPFATRELAMEALRSVPAALGLRPIVIKR